MRLERVECLMCLTFLRVCIKGGRAVNHEAVEELALKHTYPTSSSHVSKGQTLPDGSVPESGFSKETPKNPNTNRLTLCCTSILRARLVCVCVCMCVFFS